MPLGLSVQELGHVARTMAERLEQLAHTPEPGAAGPRSPQPGDLRIATDKGPRTIPADVVAPFLLDAMLNLIALNNQRLGEQLRERGIDIR
ncbi:MAG: hypothetical protein EXR60_05700 [Dehalococcoidia bacterium]|nr:hypothetical protein [Dehalococcoidia bacterium]